MIKLTLKVMYANWKELTMKATLSGMEALEAVKRNGYALSYVKEQTPEVCLEAVKNDGYALRYVKEHVFKAEISLEA